MLPVQIQNITCTLSRPVFIEGHVMGITQHVKKADVINN